MRLIHSIVLLALLLLAPTSAAAHSLGLSMLELEVDDTSVRARLTSDLEHLSLAAGLDTNANGTVSPSELEAGRDALAAYLAAHLRLSAEPAGACTPQLTDLIYDAPRTAAILEAHYECHTALGPLEVDNSLFHEQRGAHRLMVVIVEDGRRLRADLDRNNPRLTYQATPPDAREVVAQTDPGLEPDASSPRLFARFVVLGVEHILLGFDHVLFLLTLLLAARRLRDVVGLVTAFTVAHSLTLALAALGWVQAASAVVEPLIALSIVLVALENVLREAARQRGPQARVAGFAMEPGRARLAVIFGLGLVHGFGFAGVLQELGLPTGERVVALAGFNIGVELGQLALVLASWPLLRLAMRRAPQRYSRAIQLGSVAIALVGLAWLAERLLE